MTRTFTPLLGALLLALFACLPVFALDYDVLTPAPAPDYASLTADVPEFDYGALPQHVAFLSTYDLIDAESLPSLPTKAELFKPATKPVATTHQTGLVFRRGACGGAGCMSANCAAAGCNANGACQAPACQAPAKTSHTSSASSSGGGGLFARRRARVDARRSGGNSSGGNAKGFACASCR